MDTKEQNVEEMMNKFISELVSEAGMDKDLEKDVLDQLKSDLKNRLENRINATILSQISSDKLDEFEKLLDAGDATATQNFCADNIPNLNEIIAAEFLGFRNRYISNSQA